MKEAPKICIVIALNIVEKLNAETIASRLRII